MKILNTSIFKNIRNICYSIRTFSSIVPVVNTTGNKGWKYRYGLYVGVPTPISLPFVCYSSVKSSTLCNGLEKVELGYLSEFNEGDSKQVKVYNGKDTVLVTNVKGRFYITGSSCPHFSASFADGSITDELLVCPWHNAKYELKDGSCVNGPCFDGIATYEPVVENGKLYALLPPTPLPVGLFNTFYYTSSYQSSHLTI